MGLPSLLAAFPRLVRRVPKTGPGSQLLKQAMAILMLAAAAYFIGIGLDTLLSDPAAPAGRLYWWPVMILCAAAGLWTGLRAMTLSTGKRAKAIWAALGAAVAAICLGGAVRLSDTGPIAWVAYSPERLNRAFKGTPDRGDDLHRGMVPELQGVGTKRLGRPGAGEVGVGPSVLPMKVDLTGATLRGEKKLQEAGSLTIPLLVVYSAGRTAGLSKRFLYG